MRTLKIFTFIFITLLTSCNFWNEKFTITNKTSYIIDSIRIYPDKNLGKKFISLKPNESKNYNTEMSGGGTDGAYQINYKIGSKNLSKHFGYYTNGGPTGGLIKIMFQGDSISYEHIF